MFNNVVFSTPLLTNQHLNSMESVWTAAIDTSTTIRIVVQIESTPDSADNPPPNPTQNFTVSLYNLSLDDAADTTPFLVKTLSITGDFARGSVFFDVVGLAKVKLKITNNNSFSTFVTVRLSEAKMQ